MADFDDVKCMAKKGVKAVSAGNGARVATVVAAGWVGVTVAAPALIAVGVVAGVFSLFSDD
ncbi:MAG: hypothetical protein Q9O24_06200 [Gammaproteobacteria bacterium]|nr:hypothetical protein [Gammaproteobacteria bacterium]